MPRSRSSSFLVARALAHRAAQVRADHGEQARVQRAVGRQPGARAVAAERGGHRRDEPHLAVAVEVAPAPGHLAAVRRLHRLDRQLRVHALGELGRGHDVVEHPAVRRANVHVLDEAQDVAAALEVAREVDGGVVVDAALDHGVDLDRAQPGRGGRVDAVEDGRNGDFDVVHVAEDRVVERVEGDRDAVEAGVRQRLRELRQQRAVGGQRDVDVRRGLAELGDERRQVGAQRRLAAGQPQLAHAEAGDESAEACDLLERQDLVAGQELEVRAEHLARHAVAAAEVAAVGDRDAQVAQRPPEDIEHLAGVERWGRRCAAGHTSSFSTSIISRAASPRWLMACLSSPSSAIVRPSGSSKMGS